LTAPGSRWCPAHVDDNFLTRQRAAYNQQRRKNVPWSNWYNLGWWRRSSKWFLRKPEHAICEWIDSKTGEKCTRAAVLVDHKIPHRGDWNLFANEHNWQGLCTHHHSQKTASEDSGFGNPSKNEEKEVPAQPFKPRVTGV